MVTPDPAAGQRDDSRMWVWEEVGYRAATASRYWRWYHARRPEIDKAAAAAAAKEGSSKSDEAVLVKTGPSVNIVLQDFKVEKISTTENEVLILKLFFQEPFSNQ